MSERITEDKVREHFKRDPLFDAIKFEEQRSRVTKVKQCLSNASKRGSGRGGYPEFIITIPALPDDIIVVECKDNSAFHESEKKDNPVKYAVDGVLHYSGFLSKEYNVISIAVSGEDILRISSFYQKQGEKKYTKGDSQLLDICSYIKKFKGESYAKNIESRHITRTAIELNDELNDHSVVEHERCILISAILLALQNESFRRSYKTTAVKDNALEGNAPEPSPERLADSIVTAIKNVLQDNNIDDARVSTMIGEYDRIKGKELAKEKQIRKKKATRNEDNYVLRDITEKLEKRVLPLIGQGDKGYDVLARFYTAFIRYAGTDKKTGLVLTPQHITEFFCDIVNLNKDDVVFDSCCGTGGFLIAAMRFMIMQAGDDETKKKKIKARQIVGIEKRTDMFTFACSNMMMSGDGKSNIYEGNSFDQEHRVKAKKLKPTVSFLNPPYDAGEVKQLEFIENALSCTEKGGRCAAIVQMSCATSKNYRAISVRKKLLKKHTLTSVLSMPNDLFHPIGVITCVMPFKAHEPHPDGFKSYFGYFKDDGFVKTKPEGRIDAKGKWQDIRAKWFESYLNRESEVGLSVMHFVRAEDEWCAEAYMKTDYSTLKNEDFIKTIKNYVAFQFLHQEILK